MGYQTTKIMDGIWAIQDNTVRMFLLDGGDEAILIDTGFGSGGLRSMVSSLVGDRVTVVNTHAHGDHISGNSQFDRFVTGEKEYESVREACPAEAQIRTVKEGDVIRAGSICLTVLDIPGHTPGSIALLDEGHRLLFSADSVAKHFPVYMQYPGQDLEKYLDSLRKMRKLRDRYDRICPCHGELEAEPEYLEKTIRCCEGILDGTIRPGTALNSAGSIERAYWYEDVAIFHA